MSIIGNAVWPVVSHSSQPMVVSIENVAAPTVIGDGRGIRITFDKPITQLSASDYEHFSIAFEEPIYVPGGAMTEVTRTPDSIAYPYTVNETVDLTDGTFSGTQIVSGALCLAEAS